LDIKKLGVHLQSNNKQILENMVTIYFDNSPISANGQRMITNIAESIIDVHGDKGSCVMGMKLKFKGMVIAGQIAQGSLTNEYFFDAVIDGFEERGYNRYDFTIDYGRMD